MPEVIRALTTDFQDAIQSIGATELHRRAQVARDPAWLKAREVWLAAKKEPDPQSPDVRKNVRQSFWDHHRVNPMLYVLMDAAASWARDRALSEGKAPDAFVLSFESFWEALRAVAQYLPKNILTVKPQGDNSYRKYLSDVVRSCPELYPYFPARTKQRGGKADYEKPLSQARALGPQPPSVKHLAGKCVRVSDPGLLVYLLPEWQVMTEVGQFSREKDVIYVGELRSDLRATLDQNTRRWVSAVGAADVDLETRVGLVTFVLGCHGRKPSQALLALIDALDEAEFMRGVKLAYQCGTWPYGDTEGEQSLFDLFKATGIIRDAVSVYLKLLEDIPAPLIEAGYLTFLLRVREPEEQQVSAGYLKVITTAAGRVGRHVRSAAAELGLRRDLPLPLRFVNALFVLHEGKSD